MSKIEDFETLEEYIESLGRPTGSKKYQRRIG